MCFSASASFIAGGMLTATGIVSISRVKKPAHFLFACIPLCFGIQQTAEGFLWLSFSDLTFADWHSASKYVFLIFAQVIWPFLIPLAFLLIEPTRLNRKRLTAFLVGGIMVSLVFACRLILTPATAKIDGCHVEYELVAPLYLRFIAGMFYLGAIVVAPFFSSWKRARILASVNVVSLVITQLFFDVYFVSIWCFFAAIQSVIIVAVMREVNGATSSLAANDPIESGQGIA